MMNFVGLDLAFVDQWYWARTRDQASHDPIPIPLGYRGQRRQYEQLSQFGGIIRMMEAGCSARRVARQLGHSDCVVRRCSDQYLQDMLFTRGPGSQHALNRPVVEKIATS
ncbi:hypothetical protein TNCV_4443551 [Trichonephila clavipes]|nr:hypothetical protein TNCV_4443551 [Trichonephila clavipes]